jgi:hypothetical protein
MKEEILRELSAIITEKSGLHVGYDHIHESNRRYYYIPEADEGKPLFLHHYRGPFFVDIPKADWHKLETGEISPREYVDTAHWYFGYYWGGGNMYTGGYFTPLECTAGIHDKEKIRRIMKPFSCKGSFLASGYRPTAEQCQKCDITSCPFSSDPVKVPEEPSEIKSLPDNRGDFFDAVNAFIKKEYGYKLHGMCAGENIPLDEVKLYPNSSERTFELYIGDEYVKELLYDPKIAGFNWDREVEAKKLYVCKPYTGEKMLIESPEDFHKALIDLEIIKMWEEEEEKRRQWEEKSNNPEPPLEFDFDFSEQDKPESIWTRFCNWLKSIFG